MEQTKTNSRTSINYWVNISSLVPFILLIISGFILQLNYHFGHNPETDEVFSLNKQDWLLLHKIFTLISTPIIFIHLALHYKWIKYLFMNKISSKGNKIVRTTKVLLILYFLTFFTSIISFYLHISCQNRRHYPLYR
jgi:hypothetical protein